MTLDMPMIPPGGLPSVLPTPPPGYVAGMGRAMGGGVGPGKLPFSVLSPFSSSPLLRKSTKT